MKRSIILQPSAHGNQFSRLSACRIFTFMLAACLVVLSSCKKEETTNIALAGDLAVTPSVTAVTLNQKNDDKTAVTLNWTTGSNSGTGASISYVLQIDKAGNNFANPLAFDMGKAVYEKSFKVSELNESLLNQFGFQAGISAKLEARVIATVYDTPQTQLTSKVVTIDIATYAPVSKTLFIIGDASPNGWSADNATLLAPTTDNPTVFVYKGALSAGSFKFITSKGQFLPAYQKGADGGHIIYRTLDSEPDGQFTVTDPGMYKVTVSLLDLTVTLVKLALPAYDHIYMVGDASPNGWTITSATELTPNPDNPYLFTYTGVMKPGDFKFPVNRNDDWGQDMFEKTSDSTMYLHKGGTAGDDKWTITKKGHYVITLNLMDNTISMKRTKLYMVGDASPAVWSIDKAVELTEGAIDGCIFTYSGPMTAGDFKLPVNRRSDWGQDMYMPVQADISHMYRHVGGAADDFKWKITAAGNYTVVANLETLGISILKQ